MYETGFPSLGMQYRYNGQTNKVWHKLSLFFVFILRSECMSCLESSQFLYFVQGARRRSRPTIQVHDTDRRVGSLLRHCHAARRQMRAHILDQRRGESIAAVVVVCVCLFCLFHYRRFSPTQVGEIRGVGSRDGSGEQLGILNFILH